MDTMTQAGLVLALVALLALLLLLARRRRRVEGAATEAAPDAQTHAAPEPAPEMAAVEATAEPTTEPTTEPTVELVVEPAAEPTSVKGHRRRRGRRSRRDAAEVSTLEFPELAELSADESLGVVALVEPAVDAHAGRTPEQVELRALREQLRVLEEMVQGRPDEPPAATLARVEDTAAEQSAAYLRQVSLVVRGLADHTSEDESPRRTLARVAAAVERLGVPNSMERPILPVTHELTAAEDASRGPSHRRELAGPAGAPVAAAAPADVFAGLDAPLDPVAVPEAASPVVAAPAFATAAPVAASPAAASPVMASPVMAAPAVAPVVPAPVLAAPVAAAPAYAAVAAPAPVPVAHVEPALPRYDEVVVAEPDAEVLGTGPVDEDGGIPAFQESEVVLPVPPPAAPQETGRRRGRSRRSR